MDKSGLKYSLIVGFFEQSKKSIFDKSKEFLPSSVDIFFALDLNRPIPVAAWSKAWICGRSLSGIVSSNSAGGNDICLV
jgi:hypothetical protein